jgi:hypothetical protein
MSSNKKIHIQNLRSINLENLLGNNETSQHTYGKLDLNSLYKTGKNSEHVFDSEVLLNGVKKKKAKITQTYNDIYKGCCKIIVNACDAGISDIVYEVPEYVLNCLDYDSKECLKFIKQKLLEQNISGLIISSKKIFITWFNLESKLSKQNIELSDE